MWDAYVAGTIPVGAVVVDDAGEVVSRGRNRIFDDAHDTSLARSRLAHAELNALIPLGSERTYEALSLYTALEPCHLCLSAAISVRIGTLHYAAPDPYGGAVGKLIPSRDHDAHPVRSRGHWPALAGRLPNSCTWPTSYGDCPAGPSRGFIEPRSPTSSRPRTDFQLRTRAPRLLTRSPQ
jgi:tRNA(Arg) A34 adenosine deaminase TadA